MLPHPVYPLYHENPLPSDDDIISGSPLARRGVLPQYNLALRRRPREKEKVAKEKKRIFVQSPFEDFILLVLGDEPEESIQDGPPS